MMGPLRKNSLLITLVIAASAVSVGAFSTVSRAALAPKAAFLPSRPLFMAEGDDTKTDDGTIITSGRKEIAYDEATGRFFETGLDEGECIPDEEFCITDKQSGNLIRLTVEEKERIFLDALQVCQLPLSSFRRGLSLSTISVCSNIFFSPFSTRRPIIPVVERC
jgi:hypothetical protein